MRLLSSEESLDVLCMKNPPQDERHGRIKLLKSLPFLGISAATAVLAAPYAPIESHDLINAFFDYSPMVADHQAWYPWAEWAYNIIVEIGVPAIPILASGLVGGKNLLDGIFSLRNSQQEKDSPICHYHNGGFTKFPNLAARWFGYRIHPRENLGDSDDTAQFGYRDYFNHELLNGVEITDTGTMINPHENEKRPGDSVRCMTMKGKHNGKDLDFYVSRPFPWSQPFEDVRAEDSLCVIGKYEGKGFFEARAVFDAICW
ncbi:MAG: hypothetical protein V1740_04555 [Candidatus Woesearchaeota archaeon]